ncbi:small ribosomal subunit protein uS11m isoform X2 [Arvicanthis niloticus]|uniref:small ribosomal subunit protein uS11m isoform X2 n=1 Tax=Arvicanthis niloticus TaxID=61156 RepID=UPI00402B9877
MQVVRNSGSWLLRSWAGPGMTRLMAIAPAKNIHTGAPRLEDSAARQNTEKETAPSRFSIYPPVPGQEGSLQWAGMKFEEVPIAHIKATYNNTQIQVVSATNTSLARASCGTEGFRNAKKGTGIAAQTAGIAAAASAIKGLTMGGLEVISITDNTPVPHNGCRPRKARRL